MQLLVIINSDLKAFTDQGNFSSLETKLIIKGKRYKQNYYLLLICKLNHCSDIWKNSINYYFFSRDQTQELMIICVQSGFPLKESIIVKTGQLDSSRSFNKYASVFLYVSQGVGLDISKVPCSSKLRYCRKMLSLGKRFYAIFLIT